MAQSLSKLLKTWLVCTALAASALAMALPTPKDIEAAVSQGQLTQAETLLRQHGFYFVDFSSSTHYPYHCASGSTSRIFCWLRYKPERCGGSPLKMAVREGLHEAAGQ